MTTRAVVKQIGAAEPWMGPRLPDTADKGVMVWGMGPLDYVADEYFVSGFANVYEPISIVDVADMTTRNQVNDEAPASYEPVLLSAEQPYLTRVTVYRPRDAARFSGNVIVEFGHPSRGGMPASWGNISKYMARNGEMHVTIQHPLTMPAIKAADPERYAPLEAVHFSQGWDMLAQVAGLLRSGELPSELARFRPRRLYLTGFSLTGLGVANFINYHHERTRQANGRPLFDGYLPMAWNAYVRPVDVPVIQINTECETTQFPERGLASRREDLDGPVGAYRLYEITGSPHINLRPKDAAVEPVRGVPYEVDWGGPKLSWTNCVATFPAGAQPNDLPLHFAIATMFDHMYRWVETGEAPPYGARIALNENLLPRRDADGNAIGGVRLPDLDVPIATRGVGEIHDERVLFGYMLPFGRDELKARYGSQEAYVDQVQTATDRMVAARLLRADIAGEVIAAAQARELF
ncbi:MAG: alpha/beta hydrolase domain-containing protein [Caulobacteraceae bacterium]